MIDYAALRTRYALKADCTCYCGSKVFGVMPLLVTNYDGRSLTSQLEGSICCAVYVLLCSCGERYLMSARPMDDQENTLIPFNSPEARELLEPVMPDFAAAITHEVEVKKS